MSDVKPKPLRLWPAALIVLICGAVAAWFWYGGDIPQQQRNLRTFITVLIGTTLLFLWFLLFSRARWTSRLLVLLLVAVCILIAPRLFVISDVSGDLVPRVQFKWSARRNLPAPAQATAQTNSARANAVAGEFPGFLGADRTGVIDNATIDTNWTTHPPNILWKQPIGAAWSGFAVKDGLAITQEQRGESEYVVCYELLTGKTVWAHQDEAKYATTIAGEGPRATPVIATNRVYTFGATGILNCLDLLSGKLIWSKDTLKENSAKLQDWGMTSSPLIIDGKAVVSVGGDNGRSLVAYSADTGDFVWAEGFGRADYSSPVAVDLLGQQQILIFNSEGVISHHLDGRILWKHPWPGGHPHITVPVAVSSNQVLVSSGYGTGAELLRIDRDAQGKWSAQREWKSMALKSKFAPMFVHQDHIYGLDDGIFTCVELKTGQRKWKEGRYGHGQALLVGGLILLTSEKGDLVLIEPNPEKLLEIGRVTVFSDKTWNPPAVVGQYVLMRNHLEAACLQLYAPPGDQQNIASLLFAKHVLPQ